MVVHRFYTNVGVYRMNIIKNIYRKLIYNHRSSSDSMIRYLRKKGMQIGDRVNFFSPETTEIDITRPYMIKIGDDVQITKGVTILTHDYAWAVLKRVTGEVLGSAGRVQIGNNVFIGMNSTILKGVTIGDNVVIGANSLINKSVPPNSVVAGVPAKVIFDINTLYKKRKNSQIQEARSLTEAYYEVYHRAPSLEEFREFFWLFCNDPNKLIPDFTNVMKLVGNEAFSNEMLKHNEKSFENYNEFIDSILMGETV